MNQAAGLAVGGSELGGQEERSRLEIRIPHGGEAKTTGMQEHGWQTKTTGDLLVISRPNPQNAVIDLGPYLGGSVVTLVKAEEPGIVAVLNPDGVVSFAPFDIEGWYIVPASSGGRSGVGVIRAPEVTA